MADPETCKGCQVAPAFLDELCEDCLLAADEAAAYPNIDYGNSNDCELF